MAQVIRFVHFAEPHFLKLNIKVHPTNPDTIFSVNDSSLSFKDFPTSKFSIKFDVNFNINDLEIVLPENERDEFWKNTKLAIRYVCKSTRQRALIDLIKIKSLDEFKGEYCFEALQDFAPETFDGHMEFMCLLIRTKEVKAKDGYLTDEFSLLGESFQKTLHIKPYEEPTSQGTKLLVKTGPLELSNTETLSTINALYQFNSDEYTITLNENFSRSTLRALEHEYSAGASSKKIQDVLFAPMEIAVWEQLGREAFEEMSESSDGVPLRTSELGFPLQYIAETIAETLYNGSSIDSKEWLESMLLEESSKRNLIDKLIPLAAQEIVGLQDYLEPVTEKFKY
jgi:hypothetical protein